MEENQSKIESKTPGVTPSRTATYQKIAIHTDKIINKLLELMESRNENVALGATNTLINKILPDLRATEVTGEDHGPIKIIIVSDNGDRDSIANPELPKATVDIPVAS